MVGKTQKRLYQTHGKIESDALPTEVMPYLDESLISTGS
jgi:hypothetical protein